MAERDFGLVREPEEGEVRQAYDTVGPNDLRLDEADAERLVSALAVDHAGAFNLFYLLRKHYWTAAGAEHEAVADFLEDAYGRAREMNDDLAERIVELGGVPPNTPPTLQAHAEVRLEAEHVYDLRASLEGDLEAYATLAAGLRETVDLAEELGDAGTSERVRDHLETVEDDADTVEQFLADDSLVREGVVR